MEKATNVSVTSENGIICIGDKTTININHAGCNGASSQPGKNISGKVKNEYVFKRLQITVGHRTMSD